MLLDEGAGSGDVARECPTPVEQLPLHMTWPKGVTQRVQGVFDVEWFAREDVDVNDAAAEKRVDADVALGDEHEAREAGDETTRGGVAENVRGHDPRHANAIRHALEQPIQPAQLVEAGRRTPGGLVEKMRPEAHRRDLAHSNPRPALGEAISAVEDWPPERPIPQDVPGPDNPLTSSSSQPSSSCPSSWQPSSS